MMNEDEIWTFKPSRSTFFTPDGRNDTSSHVTKGSLCTYVICLNISSFVCEDNLNRFILLPQ